MKRFVIIIILLYLAGCAPKSAYVIPQEIRDRLVNVTPKVGACITPTIYIPFNVYPSPDPNAILKDDIIYFSEALFDLDDNTLKFVMAHEIAHQKLGHEAGKKTVRAVTAVAMLALNIIVPGAGLLGYAAHPLSQATYGKPKELEADLAAYHACICMGMTKEDVLTVVRGLFHGSSGGGLWDQHPSPEERITNIQDAPQ